MKWRFNPFTGKLDRIDIQGPSSSTDNAIVRWDSTTGDIVQDSLYHTITDAGNTTMKSIPNSFDAFKYQHSGGNTMMRCDTRLPGDMPAGSAKYAVGGIAGGEGSDLVGSNTAHYSLVGTTVLGSGSQTTSLVGLIGTGWGRGTATMSFGLYGTQNNVFWQSSGANTGVLVGMSNNISVGSSSQVTGNVSSAYGDTSTVGFFSGTMAASITSVVGFLLGTPTNTDATHTIGTYRGINIQDLKKPGVTNTFALDINAQSAGGYAIRTGNGEVEFGGGISFKRTTAAGDHNTTINDYLIAVTSTAAPRTVTLMTATNKNGRQVTIKDESGGAAANNITIATEGAELIDGAATITISTNYGFVRLYSNGTNWFTR